jgi:hypothetical protein
MTLARTSQGSSRKIHHYMLYLLYVSFVPMCIYAVRPKSFRYRTRKLHVAVPWKHHGPAKQCQVGRVSVFRCSKGRRLQIVSCCLHRRDTGSLIVVYYRFRQCIYAVIPERAYQHCISGPQSPPASSQPIEQPIKNVRINAPRRSEIKLAIRHGVPRHIFATEERKRRPVRPNSVELRQSRDVLEFRLSGVTQPGVVDGAQDHVFLRWTDVESCWQEWVGEVACEFGLDFEAGQSGCLGWWLVIVGL